MTNTTNKTRLQCGRIYKDAEIYKFGGEPVPAKKLQCGRIYKDAEIHAILRRLWSVIFRLQCGRIYKDAEIAEDLLFLTAWTRCFNVAASIKMRK